MKLVYILVAILFFGFFIAAHEFGHFITAKSCGVRVEEYSIGMGPLLWQKQGKETAYSLRLLPLGGYCAIEGEDGEADSPRSLSAQGYWKQVLVFAAGALMNFLIGLILLLVIYASAQSFLTPTVVALHDGFPDEGEQGIMVGDTIYALNGERIYLASDVELVMQLGKFDEERTLHATLLRDGEKIERTLRLHDYTDDEGNTVRAYGFSYGGVEKATPLLRLRYAWYNAIDFVRMVRMSLRMLLTGEAGVRDLSGPVGIVSAMEQVGTQSESRRIAFENIAYYAALVTVNLAVMNLLPIPALDGGKILFLTVNTVGMKLFGKRISARAEQVLGGICFSLLIALMLFVTFSDITKLLA